MLFYFMPGLSNIIIILLLVFFFFFFLIKNKCRFNKIKENIKVALSSLNKDPKFLWLKDHGIYIKNIAGLGM